MAPCIQHRQRPQHVVSFPPRRASRLRRSFRPDMDARSVVITAIAQLWQRERLANRSRSGSGDQSTCAPAWTRWTK